MWGLFSELSLDYNRFFQLYQPYKYCLVSSLSQILSYFKLIILTALIAFVKEFTVII